MIARITLSLQAMNWNILSVDNVILLHQSLLQGALLEHIPVEPFKQQLINKKIIH